MRQGALRSITWMIVLLMILLTGSLARGQGAVPAGPGWHLVSAPPVSPDEARQILPSRIVVPLEVAFAETEATPEIQALARGLRNDPKLMFDYVHNNIEYVPMYGLAKDATATFLAGRGNDLEQAALLVALLRAAGFTANFVTGDVVYEVSRLGNWLGVPNDINTVLTAFANAGVPVEGISANTVKVTRAWVRATIQGQPVDLDPAMKEYREIAAGVNVASASGYDRTAFLNRAQTGATVTSDYIRNANQANVRTDLATWSSNLITHIRNNMPAASVADVIGGREVIGTEMASYPTSLPYALSVTNTVVQSSVPASLCHTLRLQYADIDQTFRTYEVTGRRLTIFHRQADLVPELKVDGTVIASGTAAAAGQPRPLTVTIDHPYAAMGGTFADQQAVMQLRSGASYCVMHDFDAASAALISRRNNRLGAALASGMSPASEEVLGESLSIMGLTWFQEERLFSHLLERLGKVLSILHHQLGLVAQDEGYFFDIPMAMTSFAKKDASVDGFAPFRANSMMTSAFEHGVLEQLQGLTSVSTIRAMERAVASGQKILLATPSNWAAVKPQLIGYSAAELASFEAALADPNQQFVLTENRLITLNEWQGSGWIGYYFDGSFLDMQMRITGGYAGGYVTYQSVVQPNPLWRQVNGGNLCLDEKGDQETPKSKEPVDMATGAYLSSHTDLVIGGEDPLGLAFTRAYTSSARFSLGSLGYGWNHANSIAATTISDGDVGLGSRTAVDAAPLILFTHVLLDLLQGTIDAVRWTVADLATEWAMDMLTDNTVLVKVGTSSLSFVALPDGSFNPPPGEGHQLIRDGDGWHFSDPFGTRIDFDNNGLAVTRRDSNNNTQTFTYDASSRLQTVACDTGLSFTLSYTGNLLTGVNDSSGRSISYLYTGNLLTAYRDAMAVEWRYEYGAGNVLTKVFKADPPAQALITNTYDGFGRVISQTDALARTNDFFYGGALNTERYPDGNEVTYFFDGLGRLIRRQDQLGGRTEKAYDGQNRPIRLTDRVGGITETTYHEPTGMIASITNSAEYTTTFTYSARTDGPFTYYDRTRIDYPDGTNEQFGHDSKGNMISAKDQLGNTVTFTRNARGQVLTATNSAGGASVYTYNADGTLASSTDNDPVIGIMTYTYDAARRLTRVSYPDGASFQSAYDPNDRVTSITDENNHTTFFAYDVNENLTKVTDPQGNETKYAYNLLDHLVQVADTLNHATTYTYDAMDRVIGIADPNNITTNYGYDPGSAFNLPRESRVTSGSRNWDTSYDAEGLITDTTTPLGHVATFEYDDLGILSGVTNPLGKKTSFGRDSAGRVTSITDPLGRVLSYAYDGRGILTSMTTPVVGSLNLLYDALGNLTRLRDLNGKDWNFSYTANGRLKTMSDPLGRTTQQSHDNRGRVTTLTLPDGNTVTRTYDNASNLIREQFSGGPDLQFTYNALDLLTSADGLQLSYDAEGRITGTTDGFTFGTTYDAGGRVATATYNNGAFNVSYTYDGTTGLLKRVSDSLTGTQVDFAYDNDDRLTGILRSNGVNATYTYDAADRVIRIQDGSFLDLVYTLDAAGQVTQMGLTAPLLPDQYLVGGSHTYSFDDASQISNAGYGYDAQGRLVSASGATYVWDRASRLVGVNGTTLQYNGLGYLRAATSGGATIHYYYNHGLNLTPLVAERDESSGQFERYYVYTPGGHLLYLIDAADGNKVYFYHFDRIGSTLALTGQTGTVTDSYAYNPYGVLLAHQGNNSQPFTFVGQWGIRQEDMAGTFYQMHARYYDAVTARFISPDPIWPKLDDPLQINLYAYGSNNPILYVDLVGTEGEMNDSFWQNLNRDVGKKTPPPPPEVKPRHFTKPLVTDRKLYDIGKRTLEYQKWRSGGTGYEAARRLILHTRGGGAKPSPVWQVTEKTFQSLKGKIIKIGIGGVIAPIVQDLYFRGAFWFLKKHGESTGIGERIRKNYAERAKKEEAEKAAWEAQKKREAEALEKKWKGFDWKAYDEKMKAWEEQRKAWREQEKRWDEWRQRKEQVEKEMREWYKKTYGQSESVQQGK